MKQELPINAGILRWARESAGFTLSEAAARANIGRRENTCSHFSPADRLNLWETGIEKPSLGQLENLAKAYRRPLITFFLKAPPKQSQSLVDFRVIPDSGKPSVYFSAFLRKVNSLHKNLKLILQEESKGELEFVGSISLDIGVKNMAETLRRCLGVEENLKFPNQKEYFKYLRSRAHALGIYVLLMGDLGGWRSQISPSEFRGIAIADKIAPLIVINKNDNPAARIFTFAHELAHIWLGFSGISNNDFFGGAISQRHEKFCNAVAAEFLAPEGLLRRDWQATDDLEKDISRLAKIFWVSDAVICRRLKDIGLINNETYERLFDSYLTRWKQLRKERSGNAGGPSPAKLSKYYLGEKILATFQQATENGHLTLLEAARALNISVNTFEKAVE